MKQDTNEKDNGMDFFKGDNQALFGGGFLIFLGIIFYMNQLDIRPFGQSSWVLFMFIPVYWVAVAAWKQYEQNGRRFSGRILFTLFWGIFPFLFVFGFIFGLSSSLIWPAMFIVIGLSMIFGLRS